MIKDWYLRRRLIWRLDSCLLRRSLKWGLDERRSYLLDLHIIRRRNSGKSGPCIKSAGEMIRQTRPTRPHQHQHHFTSLDHSITHSTPIDLGNYSLERHDDSSKHVHTASQKSASTAARLLYPAKSPGTLSSPAFLFGHHGRSRICSDARHYIYYRR